MDTSWWKRLIRKMQVDTEIEVVVEDTGRCGKNRKILSLKKYIRLKDRSHRALYSCFFVVYPQKVKVVQVLPCWYLARRNAPMAVFIYVLGA